MNRAYTSNIIRFIIFVLIQGLILRQFTPDSASFFYFQFFLYPLVILFLPLKLPDALTIIISFILGLSVDFFYHTPGVHASASVFTGFLRPYVLKVLEPRGGYDINQTPTRYYFGINWFLQYASVLLLAHLFFYYSVEAFSFVYILSILKKTFFSFLATFLLVIIYEMLFNPKE